MSLPSPNLDDRTFAQLVAEARQRIAASCPAWTDHSDGDPGMVLLDVFAYLTDTMIYRLNRVPGKAYIEFLRLLGVRLLPPASACVNLLFTLSHAAEKPVEIPRGTRVSVSRSDASGEPPIFVTAHSALIPSGNSQVEVLAHHCDLVETERAGKGTAAAGLSVKAKRPPIVAPTGEELDLVVGVEAALGELDERAPARQHGDKTYRIWREVENFTQVGPDPYVYIADRMTGTITFAPAVRMRDATGSLDEVARPLAAVPPLGREIMLWYRSGGGPQGNVAANTLTLLKDSIPGVSVTNPAPAVGGRSAETLDNALLRGPQELHSLQRAVTARDFELVARRSGAVSRARAFTKATLWTYAPPGTVEVVLVPFLDEGQRKGQISSAQLQGLQTEPARSQIQEALDDRRPLGTSCVVSWARYKTVKVEARVVAHAEEDPAALKKRVLDRLYHTINPLPAQGYSGWRFGQALRISSVYDAVLAEPGVSYVERPRLIVEEVPEQDISCLAADPSQPKTWYTGAHALLYRSTDDGDGWELAGRFGDHVVYCVRGHPKRAGLVAVSTRNSGDTAGSQVHISWDCGETWEEKARTAFNVEAIEWILREGAPVLLLATSVGLYELSMQAGVGPVQVFVRPGDEQVGYYAVVAATDLKGGVSVAVAARNMGGVFLSSEAGKGNTFRNIGLAGENVRVLAVQYDGVLSFLWAGLATPTVGDPGKGCLAWALLGAEDPPEGWQTFNKNWSGGSCVALAFQAPKILAATYDSGVLSLEKRSDQASWEAADVRCGLPRGAREHPFERVDALAADPGGRMLFAGGKAGVFRSKDSGLHYESCSSKVFTDKVTLPQNWLFCSGDHEIEVMSEGETGAI